MKPEPPGELFEFGSDFYNEVQRRITTMIGKLSVPMMQTRHPLIKEVHQELIEFSHWWDEHFEEKPE